SVQTSSFSYSDATLMGNAPPDTGDGDKAQCLLPPGQSDRVDLANATRGAATRSGFSLEATGSIVPFCYTSVLSPYRWVLVRISDSKYSNKYLIKQVTHTLTRSIYTQSFQMQGNGVTESAGGSAGSAPQPSASLAVSFNIQVSIF
ncbi:MAG TPA: hypothetical protein VKB86_21745, partial [Pyrinomonadaceae bacterium]|nr:hypothetical protein [Pyrinomonadaceae bacterium]